jgi:hypothetical protein
LAKIGNITLKKINSTRQTLCLSAFFGVRCGVSQTVFFFNRFIFAYFLTPIPIMPVQKTLAVKLGIKMQNTQLLK